MVRNMELESLKLDKKMISNLSKAIVDGMGERIFHKLLLLRYAPEIQAIEEGKVSKVTAKELKQIIKKRLAN